MFYSKGFHVLCIILTLIIYPYSGKHDTGRGNHNCLWWDLLLMERFYTVIKLIFIYRTTNFLNIDTKDFYVHID